MIDRKVQGEIGIVKIPKILRNRDNKVFKQKINIYNNIKMEFN